MNRHFDFGSIQAARPARRGAASLVVVMVLFFIITLVAAYTSRNLLFEQRTSANQYRSTLAFEAAEAGVEWTLARLNDARMNDDCTPLASAASVSTQVSFRDRYLGIDETTGNITPVAGLIAGCVFNGSTWVCNCPASGNPTPAVTYTGNGPFAAFWVRFLPIAGAPGVVRMQVNACTRMDEACLRFSPALAAASGDGLATIWAMVTLRSALPSLPAAALTVNGAFSRASWSNPTIANTDPDAPSGGITIHSASAIDTTGLTLLSVPGTPPQMSIRPSDTTLTYAPLTLIPATPANTPANRMFNSVFGMWPDTYFARPGIAEIDCTGGCTAADVNDQALLRPGQPIRLRGGGQLDIGANIGSTTAPVLIITDGNVEFAGTNTLVGAIYARESAAWALAGNGAIQGAAMAERDFSFAADNPTISYDHAVLRRLRHTTGSFVKVPGAWRDFQP